MDGILIIDKPAEWTSHDVVGRLRRLLKTKRIGHTGTLDPFATGVLVMLVGQATRLAQFLDKDKKAYEATIQFGSETETGDLTGPRRTESELTGAEISRVLSEINWNEVLADFTGEIEQTPPMYSAKKIAGKKLYELARKGIEVERKPVSVTIYELELSTSVISDPQSQIGIRTVCSAGTYIRTLAEDLGRRIGLPCHLAALRRTSAGKFDFGAALTIEKVEELAADGKVDDHLISMNEAVSHLPEVQLDEKGVQMIRHGMKVQANIERDDVQIVRIADLQGDLLAIGHYEHLTRLVQPRLVFAEK
jgi:tRNA pseudouridine55 synthase